MPSAPVAWQSFSVNGTLWLRLNVRSIRKSVGRDETIKQVVNFRKQEGCREIAGKPGKQLCAYRLQSERQTDRQTDSLKCPDRQGVKQVCHFMKSIQASRYILHTHRLTDMEKVDKQTNDNKSAHIHTKGPMGRQTDGQSHRRVHTRGRSDT